MSFYIVSACLIGHKCRYDGKHSLSIPIKRLADKGKVIALCPEVLGGLPIPRLACEIQNNCTISTSVRTKNGQDYTHAFTTGARKALEMALKADTKNYRKAILKSRSPSCSCNMVYDGTFSKKLITGRGIWAEMLLNAGFELFSEDNLPPEIIAE